MEHIYQGLDFTGNLMKKRLLHIYFTYDVLETQYPLDIRNGSHLSVEFFSMIDKSAYDIQKRFLHIINYKFNKIRKFLVLELINLILLDFFYSRFIFEREQKTALFTVLFIQDVFFIIKELIPYKGNPLAHFSQGSFFNMIDALLMYGILILICVDYFAEWEYILRFHFVYIMLLSFRALLELRLFSPFRHFSKMILTVYIDILPFMVYLIAYFFIYALLKLINQLQYEGEVDRSAYWTYFVEGVGMAFGNYEIVDGMQFFQWFLTFFTLLCLAVVMLNVIIAIVNNTYSTYETNKSKLDLQERIEYIVDFDKLIYIIKCFFQPNHP